MTARHRDDARRRSRQPSMTAKHTYPVTHNWLQRRMSYWLHYSNLQYMRIFGITSTTSTEAMTMKKQQPTSAAELQIRMTEALKYVWMTHHHTHTDDTRETTTATIHTVREISLNTTTISPNSYRFSSNLCQFLYFQCM